MPQNLFAETLLTPGLDVPMVWRFENKTRYLIELLDEDSPVRRALSQAIDRYGETFFELTPNKESLIEWANSQKTLQDTADVRELRLGGAHVFQQAIELFQGMQMEADKEEDPVHWSAIHHNIGDVMGFIGQRSGSSHFLEQAAMSYEQALEARTFEAMPYEWGITQNNLGLVLQTLGQLEDDLNLLKQAGEIFKQASTALKREEHPDDWASSIIKCRKCALLTRCTSAWSTHTGTICSCHAQCNGGAHPR